MAVTRRCGILLYLYRTTSGPFDRIMVPIGAFSALDRMVMCLVLILFRGETEKRKAAMIVRKPQGGAVTLQSWGRMSVEATILMSSWRGASVLPECCGQIRS